jgi:hypothetical protein
VQKTRPCTSIFFDEEIQKSIRSAKKEIKDIILSLKSSSLHVEYNGQILSAAPCDFSRLLVEWKRKPGIDYAIRNVIVSAILSAEEKSQGAGFLAAGMWISNSGNESLVRKNRRCNFEEVSQCINYFGGSGFSASCALALIELGGLGHKIDYVEHSGSSCVIDIFDGKEMKGHVDPLFGDRVGRNHSFDKCAVIAVDGIVESVGSIHKILEYSQETPVVLMAKNFLPDVSNTMAESMKKSRATCLPVVMDSWWRENFLDIEKDGISCVSHDRGDTVSSLKIDGIKMSKFESVEDRVRLEFSNNASRSKIVFKVSKSLGGLVGPALDRTKALLGYARLSSRSGVIDWEDLCEISSNFSDLYSKNLVAPCSSLEGAFRVHKSLNSILQEMGCLITV